MHMHVSVACSNTLNFRPVINIQTKQEIWYSKTYKIAIAAKKNSN